MKKMLISFCTAALLMTAACKSKTKEGTTTYAPDTTVNTTAPVQVNNDDALRNGVRDATKDFPTVKSYVANGEIVLSGQIKREDWMRLKPTLDGLHPQRVNRDSLTIK
jgi:hypothetical protein